jgi:uncharacterized protein (TIGR01244 family)
MKIAIVALVAGLAVTAAAVAGEVQRIEVEGIRNFSRLDNTAGLGGATVGFGGATEPQAMAWLAAEGFASVINLRLAGEEGVDVAAARAAAETAGLRYIHLPFDSRDPAPDLVTQFLAAVGEEGNRPVYIHCGSATRTAALWMIARVLADGWDIDAARLEAEAIALKPEEAVAFATRYLQSSRD